MEKNDLKVLRGGLKDSISTSAKNFISCEATNTRLMGVTYCHSIYSLPDNLNYKYAHLFFYFDSEEFYFDTFDYILCRSLSEPSVLKEVDEISQRMSGGLGGNKVNITEEDLKLLTTYYYKKSIDNNENLPDGFSEYSFLIDKNLVFSKDLTYPLYDKICIPLENNYQVVNYFLMRIIGRDLNLANYLSNIYISKNTLPFKNASLIRNKISDENTTTKFVKSDSYYMDFHTDITYFSESLVLGNGTYYVLTSEICVNSKKVQSFKPLSIFKISDIEADFITKRMEYVILYDAHITPEFLEDYRTDLMKYSSSTEYENGLLNVIYNPNNDHVKNKIYNLADDVFGAYYLSCFGQLLLFTNKKENINAINNDLLKSPISKYVTHIDNFEFDSPVFYPFILSNYDDFNDYLSDFFE